MSFLQSDPRAEFRVLPITVVADGTTAEIAGDLSAIAIDKTNLQLHRYGDVWTNATNDPVAAPAQEGVWFLPQTLAELANVGPLGWRVVKAGIRTEVSWEMVDTTAPRPDFFVDEDDATHRVFPIVVVDQDTGEPTAIAIDKTNVQILKYGAAAWVDLTNDPVSDAGQIGAWDLNFTQPELDTLGVMAYRVVKAGVRTQVGFVVIGTSTAGVASPSAPVAGPAAVAAPAYQRMLMALLPPGKVWRYVSSFLSDLFLGCADELGRLDQRVRDLLDEANPPTASELLPEYERELDLESTGTDAERQARIVARLIARQRYRPVDFQTALAGLLGQDTVDVVVIERTHAEAVAMGDEREIFRFFIYRDPTLPGTYYLASAQALVDKIKPSHTVGTVIESIDFLTEDPYSLTDRDVLGA